MPSDEQLLCQGINQLSGYTELFVDPYGVVWYDETRTVDYGDEDGENFYGDGDDIMGTRWGQGIRWEGKIHGGWNGFILPRRYLNCQKL